MSQYTKSFALVTDASSGIGAIYADRLAKCGHDLIPVARSAERLRALADKIAGETGRKVEVIAAGLGKRKDICPSLSLGHRSHDLSASRTRKSQAPTKSAVLMRVITFILSAGIALACVPASASAAPNTFGLTSVSTCPIYEGYPDCHPDGLAPSTTFSSGGNAGFGLRHHRHGL